ETASGVGRVGAARERFASEKPATVMTRIGARVRKISPALSRQSRRRSLPIIVSSVVMRRTRAVGGGGRRRWSARRGWGGVGPSPSIAQRAPGEVDEHVLQVRLVGMELHPLPAEGGGALQHLPGDGETGACE